MLEDQQEWVWNVHDGRRLIKIVRIHSGGVSIVVTMQRPRHILAFRGGWEEISIASCGDATGATGVPCSSLLPALTHGRR
jgi:hypothetical protein